MSYRDLRKPVDDLRRKAYEDLDQAEVQEAIWEALDRLERGGIDIGLKAEDVLAQRRMIKKRLPKN